MNLSIFCLFFPDFNDFTGLKLMNHNRFNIRHLRNALQYNIEQFIVDIPQCLRKNWHRLNGNRIDISLDLVNRDGIVAIQLKTCEKKRDNRTKKENIKSNSAIQTSVNQLKASLF